jgi:IS5 family transposase
MGEEGVEWLLSATIEAARRGGVIRERSVEKVIVDTTVMEKAISHPSDSKLLETGRQHLVSVAGRLGIG